MTDSIRKTGIGVVGSVPWGTHFCQFYRTKDDLLDILVPYFRAGLQSNELCLWVTSSPLKALEIRKVMSKSMPHFNTCMDNGQIEIVPYAEYYLHNGLFSQQKVMEAASDRVRKMRQGGYSGLRAAGTIGWWLQREVWKDFALYEQEVDRVIGDNPVLAICCYPLEMCGTHEALDLSKSHRLFLLKDQDVWQVYENSRQALVAAASRHSH